MKLILGIGNPGAQYVGTRHNIGWDALDELHARLGGTSWSKRFAALVSEVTNDGERALLIKPQTYVNLSGESAQAALAFYKIAPSELLVVVDDIHLPIGALRLRADGSAGGHNGLKDIEQRIGPAYARLRIGVGAVPPGFDQVAWVLSRFPENDRADAALGARKAADTAIAWLRDGVSVACRFNGPLRPPPPRPKPPPPAPPPPPSSA